ncbi:MULTISPECIES: hypothetical protein [Cryobacterium]|uniref:Cell division protein FtsL n=1 Tax=Cryobacterium glucosi TaxID=1259175 RepID=A0ABY2IS75_9MICO|nr:MULTISPECIES: hypothetical protein [Cryobacterium]MDY7527541.1 hypothetical protein [Cryobacterium sp. 10C2]MEB0003458.1 hypothetical protein [Cryobacterium sp. RTC2.1]MEB0201930.1 hypothetical protein [Cryobacterium sp. 5I3]MEB0288162.1 hypothetical protein [Cryobacterium sp. 10S3]MEB0289372.1 hypothetical protein [Cryobacterium sp. 10C2]
MSDNLARVLRPNWESAPRHDTPDQKPLDAPAGQPGSRLRHIEIVATRSQRRARPKIAFALSAVAGVAVIIVAQLLLSVGISQGAYEVSRLQASQTELSRTADSVTEDLVRVSSPQSLAANAEAIGMISNSNPVYLRLSDSAVLGAPSSATGSQAGAASLVPNALLTGVPLVTQPAQATGQGASVAGAATSPATTTAPTTSTAAVPAPGAGLPTPTTR